MLKSGRKLTIALIKKIDSELASFPFVSHRRTRKKSVLAVNELPMKYKSYEGVKKILPNCIKNFIFGRMGRKYDIGQIHDIDFSFL